MALEETTAKVKHQLYQHLKLFTHLADSDFKKLSSNPDTLFFLIEIVKQCNKD